MKIYPAKKTGFFIYVFFGILLLVLIIFAMDIEKFLSSPIILIPLFLPIALLLWIYFDTYYAIEDNVFHYRSAFLRGKIDITQIRSVTKNANMYVGLKPALAMNGLIINYNRFDEIYIAPKDNEELLTAFIAINENIEVKED